jgi:PAS domain S-box-containing protein
MEDMRGLDWMRISHPDDVQTDLDNMTRMNARAIAGYQMEKRIVRPDGTIAWIHLTVAPIHIEAYAGPQHLAMITDITARKQAEEALRESDHLLRVLMADSPVLAFFKAMDGRYLYVNPEFERLFLLQKGQALGKTDHELFSPEQAEHFAENDRRVLQDGSALETEELARYEDWVHTNLVVKFPLRRADGALCGLGGLVSDITARKQVEQALRESEERFRQLAENIKEVFWMSDPAKQEILYISPAYQQIWGRTCESLYESPQSWLEGIAPEDRARILAATMTKQVAGTYDEEYRVVRPDGSKRWIHDRAFPVRDAAGTVFRLVGIAEDITERKQTEETLRRSESFITSVVENLPDMIFVKEAKGLTFVRINKAGEQLLGHSREALIGTSDYDHFPKADADYFTETDRQVLASGQLLDIAEEPIETQEQGRRILHTKKIPLYDDNGAPQYLLGISEDITERRQAEAALQASETLLHNVVESTPAYVFATDRQHRYILLNDELARFFGMPKEEIVGKTHHDVFPKPIADMLQATNDHIMASGLPQQIEEVVESTVGGKAQVVLTLKSPLRDEQGEIYGIVGAATDITARKCMEEQLREREQALRLAIEERQRISRDLHDGILQSLFAVGLSLEVSKSQLAPRARATAGAPLTQAIAQLNRVMHEIRNFIAGLGSDLLQGTDLPTALQRMVATLTQNQATRVRLAVEARATRAVSTAQALHLLLVIQEAVSNCIRHGHAPEARVSLKLLKQGVRLSIRDNGCGFNPAAATGTGQGLRNMAARAQQLGGRFRVVSQENAGTRIVLDVPHEAGDGHR